MKFIMNKLKVQGLKYIILITIITIAYSCKNKTVENISLDNLRCEMLINPEGIDAQSPRLSWEIASEQRNIMQKAYQVIVASSPEKLEINDGDLWNSGIVRSDQSVHIPYGGLPLKSRTKCYWKVKVWSKKGESEWSQPAYWSMGLLHFKDWQGRWIGLDRSFSWDSETKHSRLSARYFRKEFDNNKEIKSATVYIIGLGLYELYINGNYTGNQVLAPVPTDYTKTVKYNTFDVTESLKNGKNTIGVVLGNGRYYTMRQAYKPYKIKTFGYPKMLLQLEVEYADGSKQTIVTNDTWKVTPDGPIRSNNEYDGEEYDARKEMPGWNDPGFDDSKWLNAEYVQAPGGEYQAQMNENMRVKSKINPRSITKIKSGTYILDMGQNMTGWIRMQVSGKRGDKVTLRFAETLKDNGELFTANLRDAKVTDIYTLKGDGKELWEPSFVYHGFRYVEITGYPGIPSKEDFKGMVVYDDIKKTAEFKTSNRTLNQIYRNAYHGIRSNYKGMPVDCPQRNERQPWLGDRATGSLGESYIFDNARIYVKWLDDIEQSQKADGCIPDVAPAFWNYYSDNMTWPGTYILVADMLYKQYSDFQPILKHYKSMKKWMTYMKKRYMEDYIITKDSYGDWCVPPESPELIHAKDPARITNRELIATAYYYHLLGIMKNFATISGYQDDIREFSSLSVEIKNAFNRKFLNDKLFQYDNNTVTANILPLAFGLVPEKMQSRVFDNVVEKIVREHNSHISTGVVGTQWLMRELNKNGRPDIAYRIATNRKYPGWGYMLENGATTIWELWNGNTANPEMNSHNHVMLLGDLIAWFYEDLAGIKSDTKNNGFKKIIMKPSVIDGLGSVRASYHSIHGEIKSQWKSSINRFTWKISIPCNTRAEIHIPAYSEERITESGIKASEVYGVRFLRLENNRAVYEIGSGDFSFTSTYPYKRGIVSAGFIFEHAPFPESHAPTIAETEQGLIAVWFMGTRERNPDVDIWTSRKEQNGWTVPVEVANGIINDSVRYPCWNPVLYQVPDGDLLLFYKIGPKPSDWKGWMKRSSDTGLSWSDPIALPDGFIGPVKNKPVLLENGNLLCGSSTEGDGWRIHFEYTPDFGKVWNITGQIDNADKFEAIQPCIFIHKGGKLQMLSRSRNRSIINSWSSDNGSTWTPLSKTSLPNNNSAIDGVSLQDGRHLLVYNHVKTPKGEMKGARTPLNVSVSENGKKWSAALILEDSPVSQYSYPSVIQTKDGLVHIVYTWRRERIKHVVVDPSRLRLKKLSNGEWPELNDK